MTVDTDDAASLYSQAADTFVNLVTAIDDSAWSGPGLGVWDLRALVGHTSRALITVLTYLDRPADAEAIDSPQQYYALAARQATESDAVAERGRRAGEELGPRPAEAVRELAKRACAMASAADPEALISVLGGGMRVRNYLPTRTFELVAHSYDISAATGIDATFASPVLDHTAALAARIAVALGEGRTILTALTGRNPLPEGFSIVT